MQDGSNVAQEIKEGSSEKCYLRWDLKDKDWSGQEWGKGWEKRKMAYKKTEEESVALKWQCGQTREKNGSKWVWRGW